MFLAHLPLLISHFVGLYRFRPHYEFVPFVVLAAGCLIWKRWPAEPAVQTRGTRWCSALMLMGSVLLLAAGTVLNSPLLGAVSAIICTGGLLLMFAGQAAWRELMPAWALLWLTIPPPFFLDAQLIQELQAITSRASSAILNYLGVLHMRSGNVFRLPERSLFVAEACSGVHSQLVLVAVAAITGVAKRRSLIHIGLLLTAAVFWSLVANIARVTIVVAGEANGWDLAEGWQHEVLGYGLILIGFIALMSTDQFLTLLLGPIGDQKFMQLLNNRENVRKLPANARLDYWVYARWNRWLSGVRPQAGFLPQSVSELSAEVAGHSALAPEATRIRATALPRTFLVVVCGLFLLLGAAQVAVAVSTPAGREVDGSALFATVTEDSLPATLGALTRDEHGTEERERNSDEGHYTHYWRYSNATTSVRYSMDFPFVGWHELSDCYVGQGWKVSSREVHESADGGAYAQVQLRRPTGDSAILCFALHDATGQSLNPKARTITLTEKLRTNPLVSLAQGEQIVVPSEMSVQFQQFVSMPATPTDADLSLARERFETARTAWLQAGLFAVPDE